jgi:hypothetical protein
MAYNKELPSLRVEEQFPNAQQLDWRQFFVFTAENPYRCWGMNFVDF